MKGISFSSSNASIFDPIPRSWGDKYCFVNSQDAAYKNPTSSDVGWEILESLLDDSHIDIEGAKESFLCINPGYFSRLFPLLDSDEWTSFIGLNCTSETHSVSMYKKYLKSESEISKSGFSFLQENDGLLIIHLYDHSELYLATRFGNNLPLNYAFVDVDCRIAEWEATNGLPISNPFKHEALVRGRKVSHTVGQITPPVS